MKMHSSYNAHEDLVFRVPIPHLSSLNLEEMDSSYTLLPSYTCFYNLGMFCLCVYNILLP